MKVELGHEEMQHVWRTDPAKAEAMVKWINAAGWDATTVRSMTFSPGGVLVEHLCRACDGCAGQIHVDPLDGTAAHTYTVVRPTPAAPPPWMPSAVAA